MNPSISIVLDTRRVRKDGQYPAKLRVYDPITKKTKMYDLGMRFCANIFRQVYELKNIKKEYVSLNQKLVEIQARAVEVANGLGVFIFSDFEQKYFRHKGDGSNIIFYFERRIEEFSSNNQISSSEIYKGCLKMIRRYIGYAD